MTQFNLLKIKKQILLDSKKSCYRRHLGRLEWIAFFFSQNILDNPKQDPILSNSPFYLFIYFLFFHTCYFPSLDWDLVSSMNAFIIQCTHRKHTGTAWARLLSTPWNRWHALLWYAHCLRMMTHCFVKSGHGSSPCPPHLATSARPVSRDFFLRWSSSYERPGEV